MTYVTAQAVTNERGYTISGDLDLSSLRTVDLTATAVSIWVQPVIYWTCTTLDKLVQTQKYNALAFHLLQYHSGDTWCKAGVKGGKSILLDGVEYRMRRSIVHERKRRDW